MKKLVPLALLVLPGTCHAIEERQTIKCANGTVRVGASSKAALVNSCGQPSSKNQTPEQSLSMGGKPFRTTEEWSYIIDGYEYVMMINGDLVVKAFKEPRK